MADLSHIRATWSPYVWIAILGCLTAYLYWALVVLGLEGMRNTVGTGAGGTVAFLVVLMVTPPVVWAFGYQAVRGHLSNRVSSVLFATALMLPWTLGALVARLFIGGGF